MRNNLRCTDRRSYCCDLCLIHIQESHKTAPPNSEQNFLVTQKPSWGLLPPPPSAINEGQYLPLYYIKLINTESYNI